MGLYCILNRNRAFDSIEATMDAVHRSPGASLVFFFILTLLTKYANAGFFKMKHAAF